MSKVVMYLQNALSFVRRNKCWVAFGVFVVIICFLDANNLMRRFGHWREIHSLHVEIDEYHKMYERDTERLKELQSTPEVIEKIAREKYLMKNQNEDIYIFQDKEKK